MDNKNIEEKQKNTVEESPEETIRKAKEAIAKAEEAIELAKKKAQENADSMDNTAVDGKAEEVAESKDFKENGSSENATENLAEQPVDATAENPLDAFDFPKGKNPLVHEILVFFIGELIVSLIMCGIYALVGHFSYKVVTGAVLGSVVVIANFLILTLSVSHAITKFMKKRGNAEMTEEESAKFAQENVNTYQMAMVRSFILRTLLMIGSLVLGLITKQFDVLATAIPLLMYRPILYVSQLIERKKGK